jgi:hypothetical protein
MSQGKCITYINLDELPTAVRGSGDLYPFWDSSENRWAKAAATSDAFSAITVDSLGGTGDADTLITFTTNAIDVSAGGVSFMKYTQTAQNVNVWNNGAVDIDFTAKKLTSGNWLNYDAGTDALTIGSASLVMTPVVTFASINLYKATNAITAFAGGGQSSATALTSEHNSITTCATAGDSVKLPTSVAGKRIVVNNLGAAYANVYPISGDLIDALSANAPVSLPANSTITFTCTVAGSWQASTVSKLGAKFSTGTTTTTFTAGQLTGAINTIYHNTGTTPGSIATRTATQMFNDDPAARVSDSYLLRIVNAQGTGTLTVTAGSGVTLTGTATIAINSFRDFIVTYTSATALVMQNVATGTFS